MLICPKCKSPLTKVEKSYKCLHGHCYDVAKSGYVNLVLGNQKVSGDSPEMVKARTAFLNEGYYQPLADALMELVKELKPATIVDAGCGEGYYTKQIQSVLEGAKMIGFDLSKAAIHEASKKDKTTIYAISSIFDMPIASKSVDVLLNIFAPTPIEEFKRILKDGGVLIKVGPAPEHLMELKEILYEHVYENEVEPITDNELRLMKTQRIVNQITIQTMEEIHSLFMMTPYYWKTSREDAEKLNKFNQLEVTTAFVMEVYQLNN